MKYKATYSKPGMLPLLKIAYERKGWKVEFQHGSRSVGYLGTILSKGTDKLLLIWKR